MLLLYIKSSNTQSVQGPYFIWTAMLVTSVGLLAWYHTEHGWLSSSPIWASLMFVTYTGVTRQSVMKGTHLKRCVFLCDTDAKYSLHKKLILWTGTSVGVCYCLVMELAVNLDVLWTLRVPGIGVQKIPCNSTLSHYDIKGGVWCGVVYFHCN